MGDRVSIQYGDHWYNDGTPRLSATLKDHWGGQNFAYEALEFATNLKDDRPWSTPISRLEPSAVMVQFVAHLVNQGSKSLRLVPNPKDCDNSDNGHFIVWLDKLIVEKIEEE